MKSRWSLLKAEQVQLYQPFFTDEEVQPFEHPCGSSLDLLQQLLILPILGPSGLDAVLKMGPYEDRVEQDIQL